MNMNNFILFNIKWITINLLAQSIKQDLNPQSDWNWSAIEKLVLWLNSNKLDTQNVLGYIKS